MENKDNNKREMRVRKVHLLSLMATLQDIFDKGVDFVDIYGVEEEGQDTVGLSYTLGFSFTRDYMDSEYVDNFDIMSPGESPDVNIKLSDDDLNQLSGV